MLTSGEYVGHIIDGEPLCPYCGESLLHAYYDSPDFDGISVRQYACCGVCGSEWADHYILTAFEPIVDGTEVEPVPERSAT